jgi:hypothetical protein
MKIGYFLIVSIIAILGFTNRCFAAPKETPAVSSFQGTYDKAEEYWLENVNSESNESPRSAILHFLGNVASTMYHEFGHALISELELPVLGKEEDAVDAFANIMMISDEPDPILDEMIQAVSVEYFEDGKFSEPVAWDEHSMDEQRAYAVVCMLVGADPKGFKETADNADMPDHRQEACAYEWESTLNAWEKLIEVHYIADEESQPAQIFIEYEKPNKKYLKVAGLLKASGIIDDVIDDIEGTFKIPNDISVVVKSCDEENAFWFANDRQITFCYELAEKYLVSAQTIQVLAEE